MLDDQYPAREQRDLALHDASRSQSVSRHAFYAARHLYLGLHHQFVATSICAPKLCCELLPNPAEACWLTKFVSNFATLQGSSSYERPCICPAAKTIFDKLRRWQWLTSAVLFLNLDSLFSFLVSEWSLIVCWPV